MITNSRPKIGIVWQVVNDVNQYMDKNSKANCENEGWDVVHEEDDAESDLGKIDMVDKIVQ